MTFRPKNDASSKTAAVLVVLMMVVQLVVCVSFALAKQGIFQDEGYSLVLANGSFFGSAPESGVMYHDGEPLHGWASVDSFLGIDVGQIYQNQADDVHPPLYYLLLSLSYSLFPGSTSIVIACVLNAVALCAATPLLYLIARTVRAPRWMALLLCLMWVTSAGMVNCAMLVRMYALLTFFFVAAALAIARVLATDKTRLCHCAAVAAVSFLGFYTQYFFVIFAAGLYLAAAVVLLFRRRFICLAKCAAAAVAGFALAVAAFPACLDHIFFGYRGQGAIEQAVSGDTFLSYLVQDMQLLNTGMFGGALAFVAVAIAVLTVVALVVERGSSADVGEPLPRWTIVIVLAIAALFYVVVIARVAPFASIRYLLSVQPILLAAAFLALGLLLRRALCGRALPCAAILLALCVALTALGYGYGIKYLDQSTDSVVALASENDTMVVAYQNDQLLQALLPDVEAYDASVYFTSVDQLASFDVSQISDFTLYVQPGVDPQVWIDAFAEIIGAEAHYAGATIDGYAVYNMQV